ncbi:hypothetical protein BDW74DRAFT_125539 [Aspergillus multicolor]|uniref:uncharacterized protein n=1 Tax=Aspergillus multicolor TaxID=41759 RepID=UPI003CCCFD36
MFAWVARCKALKVCSEAVSTFAKQSNRNCRTLHPVARSFFHLHLRAAPAFLLFSLSCSFLRTLLLVFPNHPSSLAIDAGVIPFLGEQYLCCIPEILVSYYFQYRERSGLFISPISLVS